MFCTDDRGLIVKFVRAGVSVVVVGILASACGWNPDSVSTTLETFDVESSPSPSRSEFSLDGFRLRLLCNTSDEIERTKARIADFKTGLAAGIDVAEALNGLQVTMNVAVLPLDEDSPILTPGQIERFKATQDEILRKRAAFINDPELPIGVAEDAVSLAETTFQDVIGAECQSVGALN